MLQPLRDDSTLKKAFAASRAAEYAKAQGETGTMAAVRGLFVAVDDVVTHVMTSETLVQNIMFDTLSTGNVVRVGFPEIDLWGGPTTISAFTAPSPKTTFPAGQFVASYVWACLEQPTVSISDSVIIELERLQDGWAGEGSVTPSKETIEQIGKVLDQLPARASMPLIEVEEEDGSVSLRWVLPNRSRSFSLVFRGNGRVTGVVATVDPPRSKTWTIFVKDEAGIASGFEDQIVKDAITS